MKAISMILQIGLAIMVCMGMSLCIGIYIDRIFNTNLGIMIMMLIGIMASIRSMLVLTGNYKPGQKKDKVKEDNKEIAKDIEKEIEVEKEVKE